MSSMEDNLRSILNEQTQQRIERNDLDSWENSDFWNKVKNYCLKIIKAIYRKHWLVLGDAWWKATNWNIVWHMVSLKDTKNLKRWDLKSWIKEIMEEYSITNLFEFIDITLARVLELNNWFLMNQATSLYWLKKSFHQIHNARFIKFWRNEWYSKFKEFRNIYPKKEWYEKAEKEYSKRIKNEEQHQELISWTQQYILDNNEVKYMKQPCNYLSEWIRKDYQWNKLSPRELTKKQAIKNLDISIVNKYLEKEYWNRKLPEPLKKRKQIMSKIRDRVIELWWNTQNPEKRKDLI